MKTIIVYDINLSPEAQPMDTEIGSEYRRVSTMLYTLSARGARVKYLNLHRDALTFMDSPVVQQIMRTDGMDGFPCMTADEEIVVSGRYPSNEEILEQLGKPYVDGGVSRGLKTRVILFKDGMRNAMITIVTLMAMSVGSLLGGTAAIEMIFVLPGLGYMVTSAVTARDYPVIQGFVVWMCLIYILINLLTDISYYYMDPRVGAGMEVAG